MTREEMEANIYAYIKREIYGKKEKNYLCNLLLEKDNSFINQWEIEDINNVDKIMLLRNRDYAMQKMCCLSLLIIT